MHGLLPIRSGLGGRGGQGAACRGQPAADARLRKALGIGAKKDKLDARVIARFGAALEPALQSLSDAETLELEAFLTRRRQVVSMMASEKTGCKPSSDRPSRVRRRKASATI